MIICSNCGAGFNEELSECPYCGQIYVPGAEKEYLENLHSIKHDMSRVSELSEQVYHKEMKKTVKKTGVIFGIFVVVFLLGAGILFGLNQMFDYSESEEEIKAKILWERENFPVLDQWYEEGNYQAILDFSQKVYEEKGYNFYEWEHYNFINRFEGYQICMEIQEKIRNKEEISEFEAGEILYRGMDVMYSHEKSSSHADYIDKQYTKEEQEQLQNWKKDVESLFYDELQYTKDELTQISEDVYSQGYLSYDACYSYRKDILRRIERQLYN